MTRQNKRGLVIQLLDNELPNLQSIDNPTDPLIENLLHEYSNIFSEPKQLPPTRDHDHHIVLQLESKLVCVGPYRYPYFQKTEIEKIIQEMLQSGIVRPTIVHFHPRSC